MTVQNEFNAVSSQSMARMSEYDVASTSATFDYMTRIRQGNDTFDNISVTLMDTDDFVDKLYLILEENLILKDTVKNLWKTVQYNNEYSSFLLGQYTKEEFVDIARQFATLPVPDILSDKLLQAVKVMFSIFEDELTSHDLATMLNIDCSLIESSFSKQTASTV